MVKIILVVICCSRYIGQIIISVIGKTYEDKTNLKDLQGFVSESEYREYVAFKRRKRKLVFIQDSVNLLLYLFIILSSFFQRMNSMNINIYVLVLIEGLVIWCLERISSVCFEYYFVYYIEGRYKRTFRNKRDFWRRFVFEGIDYLCINIGIAEIICFLCMNHSTINNLIKGKKEIPYVIGLIILLAFAFIRNMYPYFQVYMFKRLYACETLPDEQLLKKISNTFSGQDRNVDVLVYDDYESNEKNAYVIKSKETIIVLSDSLLKSMPENEILATIAHEIGHIKHKRNFLDLIVSFAVIICLCFVIGFLQNLDYIYNLSIWLRDSYGLGSVDYYLTFLFISEIISPLLNLWSIVLNYRSRKEEYEADAYAKNCGFGLEMIDLLKNIAKNSLDGVRTHPLVEIIEYDHPSICNRINALK